MNTYTWGDVMSVVSQFANRQFEAGFAAFVADQAQSALWHAADWKETIAELPPFYIVPQEQDYGPPVAVIPADFWGFRKADLVQTTSDPAARKPLNIARFLSHTQFLGSPTDISYEQSNKRFRVFPRPSAGVAAPYYLIDGTYKIRPTKITPNTYPVTALPWDDQYFDTVVAVAKLKFYDLKGDLTSFAQQLQMSEYLVQKMMADEALNTGDQNISPVGGLALGWYGTYSF